MYSELPGSMLWCLTLFEGNCQSLFFQKNFLFCSLFSFWYSPYMYVTPFKLSHSLDILFCFGFLLFFCFACVLSAFQFLLRYPTSSESVSSAVSGLLIHNQRHASSLLQCSGSLAFLLGSFLGFSSPCLHCPSSLPAVSLSTRPLAYWSGCFSSQSDNSNIPPLSGSSAFPLFKLWFSPFGMSCDFLPW